MSPLARFERFALNLMHHLTEHRTRHAMPSPVREITITDDGVTDQGMSGDAITKHQHEEHNDDIT